MKLKVFLFTLVLFLLSLGWLLFFRNPSPREISYYHSLTGKAVASVNSMEELHMVMADMLLHGEDSIRIRMKEIPVTTELLGKVVEKAFSSNQDYYLKNSANHWEYLAEPDPSGSTLKIRIFYHENRRQRKYVDRRSRDITRKITSVNMSDAEKVKAIYDWVIQHVDYDTSFARHGAYHALKGRAVCQGYALLIYKMLKGMDIPSLVINGGDHMWNMVFLAGKWYHLDATYDDNPEGFLFKTQNTGYANFLKSDSVMKRNNHVWNRSSYPPAPEDYHFR